MSADLEKKSYQVISQLPMGEEGTLGESGRILQVSAGVKQDYIEIVLRETDLDFQQKLQLERALKDAFKEEDLPPVRLKFQFVEKKNRIKVEKYDPKKVQDHAAQNARPKPDNPRETSTTNSPEVPKGLEKVKRVIAVASGKGGVGKSSVSVYLAIALKELGFKVGVMDADIYGPSIPRMLGVREGRVYMTEDKRLIPVSTDSGLVTMSFGFFAAEEEAVVWRGPMLHNVIKQFLNDVDWQDLDYLIIDLPPGTGDVQLSLTQSIPLDGAVVVTTPQMVAVSDAIKAVNMFKKVRTPILGVVENMTYLELDNGKKFNIFGKGGADQLAKDCETKILGRIPLSPDICESLDTGNPFALNDATNSIAVSFKEVAKALAQNFDGGKKGLFSKLKEKLL